MDKRLVIFGAGGFGREVAAATDRDVKYVFCTDDGKHGITPAQIKETDSVIIAVGNPTARREIAKRLGNVKYVCAQYPKCISIGNNSMGAGCIFCAGVVITTDVKLGNFVIVNINATIGHDARIGDFTTISPAANISGNVTIGEGCYIGTNASIKEGVTICDNVTIGMGSVVLNDITEEGTYVGVPAKRIK